MTNEEPLVVVKAGVNIVWEVVQKNRGYGSNSMVGEGKASLRCGGGGKVHKRAFGAENGDVCRYGRICSY